MKVRTLLISVLFLVFSCSDNVSKWEDQSGNGKDLIQTVEVKQPGCEKDSIQQVIQSYKKLIKMDQDLLNDIEAQIEENRKKIESTNDLAKKSAYQSGIARFTKQKRGPMKSIQEKQKEIERLESFLK